MSISVVQSTEIVRTNTPTVATAAQSFTSLPTVGSLAVVWASIVDADTTVPTLTCADNQGNTYTAQAGGTAQGRCRTYIFTAPIATSSGTFTVTITDSDGVASTAAHCIALAEVSGQAGSPIGLSATSNGSGTDADAGTPNGLSTSMYFAAISMQNVASAFEANWLGCDGSVTIADGNGYNASQRCVFAYGLGTAIGANTQFTCTITSANFAGASLEILSTFTIVPVARYRRMQMGVA